MTNQLSRIQSAKTVTTGFISRNFPELSSTVHSAPVETTNSNSRSTISTESHGPNQQTESTCINSSQQKSVMEEKSTYAAF